MGKEKQGYYDYKTKDGYTIEVGDVVYDKYNIAYTVTEITAEESGVMVRVSPIDTAEADNRVEIGKLYYKKRFEVAVAMEYRLKENEEAVYRGIFLLLCGLWSLAFTSVLQEMRMVVLYAILGVISLILGSVLLIPKKESR